MAVIVTFGRIRSAGTSVPLEDIANARTEEIEIGTDMNVGALQSLGGDGVVTLFSDTACWFAVGVNAQPDPTGAGRRYLPANVQQQFSISAGAVIGVIAV